MIGHIIVNTVSGFRKPIPFSELLPLLEFRFDGKSAQESNMTVYFYDGENPGKVLFAIYSASDHFTYGDTPNATLFINGTEVTTRQLSINCNRNQKQKRYVLLANNNLNSISGEIGQVQVGVTFKVRIAGALPENGFKQKPYLTHVAWESTESKNGQPANINWNYTLTQSDSLDYLEYTFAPFLKVGTYKLAGLNLAADYTLTVLPGPASPKTSYFVGLEPQVKAGTTTNVNIRLFDIYGNRVAPADTTQQVVVLVEQFTLGLERYKRT